MTTPISRRQRIVTELAAVLSKITKLYGHRTDLGSNVFEWKTTPYQEVDLPCVNIRDGQESVIVSGRQHQYTLDLQLEIRVSASTSAEIAREVIADITVAIGQNVTLDGLIINITPISTELLDFGQMDKKFGSITMVFEILYITDIFKPYN